MTNKVEGLSPIQQEILNRADSIVASIRDSISKAGEFLMEQLPSLAQEYIAFGRASATIYLCIGIALFLYCWLNFWLNKSKKAEMAQQIKEHHDISVSNYIFVASMAVSGILGLITILINLSDFIKVWFAPRIWLLENIVQLVKRVT